MRRFKAMAEVGFGRVGARGTAVSRMFVVPASEADAACPAGARLTQDRVRHLLVRQSQVIDSKGH